MVTRLISALLRAVMVALLIATPAMLLPGIEIDSTQMVMLFALLGAGFTFLEYFGTYPSIVEFRDAPPFNRLRFLCLFVIVLLLTFVARGVTEPNLATKALASLGRLIGGAMDFPYSPVRLAVLVMPLDAPLWLVDLVRASAGLAYAVGLLTIATFTVLVWGLGWPMRSGAFNVWVNLPLFDPTAGGDVLQRLKRDAQVNIALGFLLPFLIPAVLKAASHLVDAGVMANPQTLVWTISAWAFLPTSIIMRGIAMARVAEMIEEKRRRAYAEAELPQTV